MEDVIAAAKEEDWEYVDGRIARICHDIEVQKRALQLLKDSDDNVRDLGASILGKAHIDSERFAAMRPLLRDVMIKDSNCYARYRAAFALAEHGAGKYKKKVLEVLRQAVEDPDVAEIAREYLERLK